MATRRRPAPAMEAAAVTALILLVMIAGCGKKPAGGGGATPGVKTAWVPDDPALIERNNHAVGIMGRYEYVAAHDIFAALVAEQPNWLDAKVNLAIATLNRQQDGDETEALRLLDEVLAVDPDHLHAHYCAGLLKLRAGRGPAALAHFRIVVDGDPDDPYAQYSIAQCLEADGDAAALTHYQRAVEIDPYLRSASYRLFQMHQRAGRREEAQRYFDDFQRLEKNPRARLVKTQYTRMGPKAEVIAVDLAVERGPTPKPGGPVFASPIPLPGGAGFGRTVAADRPANLTACDLDGDGRLDLFVTGVQPGPVPNAVLMGVDGGGFRVAAGHSLAAVTDVRAALWGDYDNDGLVDVYLCRAGENQLWRQVAPGKGAPATWIDMTAVSGTGGGGRDTVDGAFFDADHDGDLDLFCVNRDGPNELLSNNLDGTFRPIAESQGIGGPGRGSRQVVVVDLDRDRDVDIVVVHAEPPHDVFLNDRLWAYRPAEGFDAFRTAPIVAAVAADADADGAVELYTLAPDLSVARWTEGADGTWEREMLRPGDASVPDGHLAVADLDGDGVVEILSSGGGGWFAFRPDDVAAGPIASSAGAVGAWTPVNLDVAGPSIIALDALDAGESDPTPRLWRPGPGRYPFALVSLSGRADQAKSMRSNASGIGTRIAARLGSNWTVLDTLRATSGPGQSLQPLSIGLGDAAKIDFVTIDWSDGIFQSEIDLAAGTTHRIAETERQTSSCPVLFAWNGEAFGFVSDLLGVGGIGFMVAPGEYASPRPWERFLLPEDTLVPRDGVYALKVAEPMEEACYLDAASLDVYDLPSGWRMVLDERMGLAPPLPTGETLFYRHERMPRRVVNDRGEDVTTTVRDVDGIAAPVGALDHRFLGRLAADHQLTLTFATPLTPAPRGRLVLVIDGWIEYPYSQTMFAAWQAGADYRAPTLSASIDGEGWHVVHEHFGYPAGMPRRMSVPLDDLPTGVTRLRLTTNQEIYWDRIAVVEVEPCPDARRVELPPRHARVDRSGFARRTTGPQRRPWYDYARRDPLWDTRHQAGQYTAFGPATELIARPDSAVAIFGPGEEIHVEFDVPPPPPAGWSRRFVLVTAGWCKDMDLFTRDGETIEPLPGEPSPARDLLHGRYNTRYASGR